MRLSLTAKARAVPGCAPAVHRPTYPRRMPTELVDWDLALSTAQRLAGPGPRVERAEADAVVLDLRCLAEEAGGMWSATPG